MSKKIDIIGKKFFRLLVESVESKNKHGQYVYLCLCDCASRVKVVGMDLKSGHTKSCGCFKKERVKEISKTHGKTRSKEYRSWDAMKQRCTNIKNNRYKNYGGRGIKICDRWLGSFENFFEDMGAKPSPKHSIDRFPNINGNYEPGNVRWGTEEQQQRGTTYNIWFEYNGEKMIQRDWERKWGVKNSTIYNFIKRGRTFEWIYHHFNDK